MINEEIKDFCDMKIQLEPENEDIYKAIVKAIEQEPKWIPVTERIPEESTAVLVWCPERKNIYCAYYEEKRWWIFGAYWEEIKMEITAWMPLPQPYNKESGDER